MVKLSKQITVPVEAKTVEVYAKPSDAGVYRLFSKEGQILHTVDGYVPNWFPGAHFGDYLILDIDIDTGQILNWKPPTAAQLEEWIDETS